MVTQEAQGDISRSVSTQMIKTNNSSITFNKNVN